MRHLPAFLLSVALLALPPFLPGSWGGDAQAAQPNRRERTEADLKRINAQIERIRRQVQKDAVDRDRMSRELRAAEQTVAKVRGELTAVQAERERVSAELARLAAERRENEARREQMREALETQLRAAYLAGRSEPLKLLLNQRDPAEAGRNLAYYGYLGRQRAAEIDNINANITELEEIRTRIKEEEDQLRQLEKQRAARVDELDAARRKRSQLLAQHEKDSRNRSASLAKLQQQQAQLEKLLADLTRALQSAPVDPNNPFGRLQGKLAWPVAGKLAASFGQVRAGAVRWNGLLIEAARGRPVRAVHDGRVAYADWLPGMGLLIIIDHGNGYLSLYGHNETLYRQAGATVKAGEIISAAGDSGGRAESGLYFEIRRGGKPVDPRPWFRTRDPPAS